MHSIYCGYFYLLIDSLKCLFKLIFYLFCAMRWARCLVIDVNIGFVQKFRRRLLMNGTINKREILTNFLGILFWFGSVFEGKIVEQGINLCLNFKFCVDFLTFYFISYIFLWKSLKSVLIRTPIWTNRSKIRNFLWFRQISTNFFAFFFCGQFPPDFKH